jgi:ADP-ribosyl-[dinitrogen reductase] hydrolase
MTGGGPFRLAPGQWTDDTSMALCLATSLVERPGFDPKDQMERYWRWSQEGYLSSTGRCFDIGNTVSAALQRYRLTGDLLSGSPAPQSAGNGCIMRLAPVPMFFHRDHSAAVHYSAESSRTTHGATECLDACRLFGSMIWEALAGNSKDEILFQHEGLGGLSEKIQAIAMGEYRNKTEDEIHGSGYVVESLEAALWCFHRTNDFRGAILMAANLGHDADTTAAVCGQVAGAYYGAEGIPASWRDKLAMRGEIVRLADLLRTYGPA